MQILIRQSRKIPLLLLIFGRRGAARARKFLVVDELASELSGQVVFGKMDVDANPRIPSRFHVRSIPTLMVFKSGQPVNQLVGTAPKSVLREKILPSL
jgi:thioredoxin-like negative regulator of GroEL